MQTIKEIVFLLENRTEILLHNFERFEGELTKFSEQNPFVNIEESEDMKKVLEGMINIFMELRPIEKLIRFKFKKYDAIFDKLTQIIYEKENGKFFSFLSNSPFATKRKYTKKQDRLPAIAGQAEIV